MNENSDIFYIYLCLGKRGVTPYTQSFKNLLPRLKHTICALFTTKQNNLYFN